MNPAVLAILVLATLGGANKDAEPVKTEEPTAKPAQESTDTVKIVSSGMDQTTIIVIAIVCTTIGIVIIALAVFYFCYMRRTECCACSCCECGAKEQDEEPLDQRDLETPDSPVQRGVARDVPELPPPKQRRVKTPPKEGPITLDPKPEPPKVVKTRIHFSQAEDDDKKIYCVQVQGSWDNYGNFQALQYFGKGLFQIELDLPPCENLFRFLVDGSWRLDDSQPKKVSEGYEFNIMDTRPERGNMLDHIQTIDLELDKIPIVNMNFREKVEVWFAKHGLDREHAKSIVRHSDAQSFEELRSMDKPDIHKLAVKANLPPIAEEKLTRALQKPSGLEE